MRTARALLAVPMVLMLGGCGGTTETPATTIVPARGTVTYKGKPLAGGMITFEPEFGGREATGDIKPDGSYVLSSFGAEDGAVVGLHRVAIRSNVPGSRKALPAKYKSLASSGVQVEVKPGQTDYPIELE